MGDRDHWDRWAERHEARKQRRLCRQSGVGPALVGVVIIAIGALFLLQNLGIIFVEDIWQYWPVILVAIGISKLASSQYTGGLILTAIGGVFLFRNLGYLPGDVWRYLWPLILIAVGASLLLRGVERSQDWTHASWTSSGTSSGATGAATPNSLNIHLAFSGTERKVDSQEFEGGNIEVVFGSAEIDLRRAATKKEEIVLNAKAVFGGIEIWVPPAWQTDVRGKGVFGVVEDKTLRSNAPFGATAPRLIVHGEAVFGHVEVKS